MAMSPWLNPLADRMASHNEKLSQLRAVFSGCIVYTPVFVHIDAQAHPSTRGSCISIPLKPSSPPALWPHLRYCPGAMFP